MREFFLLAFLVGDQHGLARLFCKHDGAAFARVKIASVVSEK
jgi:uncharacterized protein GlcG (DUF336 family)